MVFVLVHSPLVGPLTWHLVATELQRNGVAAVVPLLRTPEASAAPYWHQHARAIAQACAHCPPHQPLILVGHSGAGMLLPVARQALGQPVEGYIFVDAGIPEDGKSRLDLFESATAAEQFRQKAFNGLLPTWRSSDLAEVIPDADLRRLFVTELRPLPLAVYEEPIPVFPSWPDAPCGYIRFGANPAYTAAAAHARAAGWASTELNGAHFHMLVDPLAVTHALLALAERMRAAV